jgi:hypothetical protein
MDKNTLFVSFDKWVAPLNSQIIHNWQSTKALGRYVKKLDFLVFLLIFVEAQLQQRKGLREVMREVQNNNDFQQALGITSISAAQLPKKQQAGSRSAPRTPV